MTAFRTGMIAAALAACAAGPAAAACDKVVFSDVRWTDITAPTAATDMMDRSAAGPGASTVLLPISAYTTKGNMLAYSPVTAGMPASNA